MYVVESENLSSRIFGYGNYVPRLCGCNVNFVHMTSVCESCGPEKDIENSDHADKYNAVIGFGPLNDLTISILNITRPFSLQILRDLTKVTLSARGNLGRALRRVKSKMKQDRTKLTLSEANPYSARNIGMGTVIASKVTHRWEFKSTRRRE